MKKSRIIQIVAIFILIVGIIHFIDYFTGETEGAIPYSGIGSLIMAAALLFISKNDHLNKS